MQRERNLCAVLVGRQTGGSQCGKRCGDSWNNWKQSSHIWSSNFTPGYLPEENKKILIWKDICSLGLLQDYLWQPRSVLKSCGNGQKRKTISQLSFIFIIFLCKYCWTNEYKIVTVCLSFCSVSCSCQFLSNLETNFF